MQKHIFHLLPNAHLDPVWLWDQREGLNEGIKTCRTMVKLLDRHPELTFNRGEAAIYSHIQQNDPGLFKRILELIAEGRWCVVGANWIQPDQNMPSTTDFFRQFTIGRAYCREQLGVDPLVAWAADPFGHSNGIPEIYAASGFRYFAFTRPNQARFPLKDEVFNWVGEGGSRILSSRFNSGWYGCERNSVSGELDYALSTVIDRPRVNIAIGFGLGDHGGGTTEKQIADLQAWSAAHPDIEIVFSTFDRYFQAIQQEVDNGLAIDDVSTELNFCLRGCYATVAAFKHQYRKAGTLLRQAELTDRLVSHFQNLPAPDYSDAWKLQLFNAFHDILPGTSLERALGEASDELGSVATTARKKQFAALNALCRNVGITVPEPAYNEPEAVPLFVYNPSTRPYHGTLELEAFLDYRPLFDKSPTDTVMEIRDDNGVALPYQELHRENLSHEGLVWRKRAAIQADIPACGWRVYTMGYSPVPERPEAPMEGAAFSVNGTTIGNGKVSFQAVPGESQMTFMVGDRVIPLSVASYSDPWGSWGGTDENEPSIELQDLQEVWKIRKVHVLTEGPEVARLFVELAGAHSRLELIVSLQRNAAFVQFDTRVIRDDRSQRLKLRMPMGTQVTYDVLGGEMTRETTGQVPGQRYAKITGSSAGGYGFAANAGFSYDNLNGFFTYSLDKANRFACSLVDDAAAMPEAPTERGELHFDMILAASSEDIPALADTMNNPVVSFLTWPHEGTLPRIGSLLTIGSPNVDVICADSTAGVLTLTLQNRTAQAITTGVTCGGTSKSITLPPWKLIQVTF